MSNLNLNLNLKALKNAAIMDIQGKTSKKQCLVIPIEDNDLFTGEKGVYLNLTAWENDKLQNGKTHLVKQSFSKDFRAKMSDEDKKNAPILGDVKPFEAQKEAVKSVNSAKAAEYDDMPF